jgi:hypothetical protein
LICSKLTGKSANEVFFRISNSSYNYNGVVFDVVEAVDDLRQELGYTTTF